jgi:predicted transcriptional regulator
MRFSHRTTNRAPALGALELKTLKLFWDAAAALEARAVQEELAPRRLSLSTVQATLERLHRKGLLARTKLGRAYVYSAAVTRESLIATLIRDVAARVAEGELEPVISGFVELVGANPEFLDQLESTAAERRKERG